MIVSMDGKLDTSTSGQARDQMNEIATSGMTKVVLNLSELIYVSSAGLSVILSASKLLLSHRGELVICNANELVGEVLATSGFNHLVQIVEDENAAIESFKSLSNSDQL